ncbi:MAG: family 43 glycosylhydrolase [Alphaproteobacteria bacterium]|nr:family 43 glycosylhydrolase [Alphaproteobacteria bacterium]MBV9372353.1 family 43 glycosylhydrolase [Alphaproteobacteria bacterium]MBV9899645.1 family 43 glycosylhydrolase [Alphaproteobacteria bacterium]
MKRYRSLSPPAAADGFARRAARFAARSALLLAAAIPAGCAAPRAPTGVPPVPAIDADFPDPAVLKARDGFYYVYATQGEREGRMVNIQVARSRDLARWETLADALPVKPSWASRTQDFWAPHPVEAAGRYYLYYSAKPDAALADAERGLCLAVATADRPEGPFTDSGRPLQCGPGFVNIDPMAYDDPATGRRLLYWGSGFGPIKVRALAPDRLSFAPGSVAADLVAPGEAPYQRLVEGAWVVRRADWYYLFFSGDNCCGKDAHYAVMVARSRRATGPFQTLAAATGAPSSAILEANARWIAPGHNSVVTDARGRDWLVYHAVDSRRPRSKPGDGANSRRVMLLGRIAWRNGWPHVAPPPAD